jgi:hypothetical protein
LAAASPALAAPEDFLNAIGGSATVKGSEKNAPEAIPLVRDAQSVIGARFFYEKISPSVMASADAAGPPSTGNAAKMVAALCRTAILPPKSSDRPFRQGVRRPGALQEPAGEFRLRLHH